jgi:catalase (peroxidase I)
MMMLTDLYLRVDPAEKNLVTFSKILMLLMMHLQGAWYKLTHRDINKKFVI